ncbi:hypothetical protein Poli38472_005295 [Pythium oligandrum]|uniref:RING-type domain-containing protein n=1 Tax=Pythium oligandrum TaxID=41045 RepID=A0A8K1CG24_PYTOL|nr:hypothetical protein Poli38472_005295 [Pythium oligandrum]|eukprot:TMW62677.1 hypothetical protein Poli38472_005295 [Pythium oligandrum]
MLCVLCEKPLPTPAGERGLTDCAHEFCLRCLCQQLSVRRNLCPVCDKKVKTVHQLEADEEEGNASNDKTASTSKPAPASIRFCNAIYVLHVSIWSVEDPARVLADLFHLEQARLIHKGALLKKGDIWPGSVVQLFGTRKSAHGHSEWGMTSWTRGMSLTNWSEQPWLQRLQQVVCCPFTVFVAFFRSMFVNDESHVRRGYQRVENPAVPGTAPSSFQAPGRVSSPNYTDSVE